MSGYPRVRIRHIRASRGADVTLLVYDERADVGHVLNPAIATVYELADGTRSTVQIAAELSRRTDLPADERIVELALQELDEAHLLEAGGEDGEGTDRPRVSRRDLMSQLALATTAVLFLPTLVSVTELSRVARYSPRLGGSGNGYYYGGYGGGADYYHGYGHDAEDDDAGDELAVA